MSVAFRCFGYLDTFDAVAHLHKIQVAKPDTFPVDESWHSGRSLVARARKILTPNGEMARVTGAWIHRRRIGTPEWLSPEPPTPIELMIPLVTNPAVVEYRRAETLHMPVGSLWWADSRVPQCGANWGETPAYFLVFHVETDLPVGTTVHSPGSG